MRARSASVTSTAGCRTVPTRTPASEPSKRLATIRRRASPDVAVAEVREVLDSIGDLCPECPTLGA
jgi:hypothetical protein